MLHSSGKVTTIVVSGLPDGLTEQTLAAARDTKFTPAMRDGRPVSQHVNFNYLFDIYDREDDPEVMRKAVILGQPEAEYTEAAKAYKVEDTVLLLVSLAMGRQGKRYQRFARAT